MARQIDPLLSARAFHSAVGDFRPAREDLIQTAREIEHYRQPGNTLRPQSSRDSVPHVGPLAENRKTGLLHYISDDEDGLLCGKPVEFCNLGGFGTADCLQCLRVASRLSWSEDCRRFGRKMPGCTCPPSVRH